MDKSGKSLLTLKYKNFPFWITDKYIYIMLLIFPLFTGFSGYTQLTVSKYIFFSVVTAIWLAAIIFCNIRSFLRKRVHLDISVELFVFAFLFFCCISAIISEFGTSVLIGEGRYDGLITILLYVGIFFGISSFGRPKESYVYAAAVSMSINCVIAVLQLFGLNPLSLFPGDLIYYDSGIKYSSVFLGTIGNADLFSAFLCLMLPLVSAYYITSKARSLWLLPAIALSSFCLFACGVSGGILALTLCLLTVAPFIITSGEKLRRSLEAALIIALSLVICFSFKADKETAGVSVTLVFSQRACLAAFLCACFAALRIALNKCEFHGKTLLKIMTGLSIGAAVCGLAVVFFWHGAQGTLHEMSQTIHGKPEDKFGSSRILIWRNVLKLVPSHLLFGGGPGTLPLRLDFSFSRFVPETGATLSTSVDNAHNEYLGILVNTGLLSLLSYLAAQFQSLFKAAKSARSSPFIACLSCSLLCYWIQAFFGLGIFIVTPFMWLFWGLLISGFRHNEV